LFEENKTAVGGVINGPSFSLDAHGYVVASGAGNARGISPHNLAEYYLLGYLNSRAVYGYLKSIASPKSGGYISIENNVLERVPVITQDIEDPVKREFKQLLADYEDDYEQLLETIQTDQIVSLINVEVTPDEALAGIVREISRYLCDNHRSLSDEEQSTLEEINHYAVYELVGFTDEDISIIEANI
jgi:succinate dehydrogenase flavin-adding protein (antitoxin of CptAB toxin-antitoxin module)